MQYSPYQTYCMFLALKFHFSSGSYDYFKYNGKVKTTPEAFEKRKDKYSFQKLSKKYSAEEMENFLVANLVFGDVNIGYAGNLLSSEADETYKAFLKRQQSLSYQFKNEVLSARISVSFSRELFVCEPGQLPLVVTLYLQQAMSLETLVILGQFIPFLEKITEDLIWPTIKLKCIKLRPFIDYDKVKIQSILKELLS